MRGIIERVDVLGVGISAIDMPMAVDEILRWRRDGEHHYVCVTGVHGVMEAQDDPELLAIHNDSGLTTPDGMPMVWASHRAGRRHVRRVYGPDLMLELCARSPDLGLRHYLYGGADGVADRLSGRLTARYPGLEIVGTWTPPFRPLTPDEDAAVVEDINASGADVVWVGLSTPKQERWMAAHAGRVAATALIGVGAAFDIHAGMVRQAPRWVQRNGFEWLYRLVQEPRRLGRRYLVNNPRFVARIGRRPPRVMVDLPAGSPPAGAPARTRRPRRLAS